MNNNVIIGNELPEITQLKARLAAVEAERDAARAALAGASAKAKAISEDRDKAVARSNVFEAEGLCCGQKDATIVVEQNAARAGEARAVEALKRIADICRPETQGNTSEGLLAHACIMSLETAECALSEQPALDWLAQQRREAAAEALEEFAYDADAIEELITCNIFDLRSAFATRAAALRAGEVGDE